MTISNIPVTPEDTHTCYLEVPFSGCVVTTDGDSFLVAYMSNGIAEGQTFTNVNQLADFVAGKVVHSLNYYHTVIFYNKIAFRVITVSLNNTPVRWIVLDDPELRYNEKNESVFNSWDSAIEYIMPEFS